MPIAYDYIVHVRRVYDGDRTEEYRYPVQAYSIPDAMYAAAIELDVEYGPAKDVKVLSIRPDVAKIGEETRSLLHQFLRSTKKEAK